LSEDLLKPIVDAVQQKFGDRVKEVTYDPKKIVKVAVDTESFLYVALYLRDNHGIDHVKAVTGVDLAKLPKKEDRIEVIYQLGSFSRPELRRYVLNLSTKIDRNSPRMQSMIQVWPSAEYHERETHEMFGVVFEGHPDLSNLLLPEYWADKPPLRKDYDVPGR